jgi:hypothetical protein
MIDRENLATARSAACNAGSVLVLAAMLALTTTASAHEDPSTDGLIDGGGSSKTDCVSRFQTGLELNYPPSPKRQTELACVDGDLSCDSDGEVNGSCTFNVGLCLADDADLDVCTPAGIPAGGIVIKNKASNPDPFLSALQSSADDVLGASGIPCDNPGAGGGNCEQCTSSLTPVVVSLAEKHGRKIIKLKASTVPNPLTGKPMKDSDKLKLRCLSCDSASAFDHINKIVFQQSCAASICHGGNGAGQAGLYLDSTTAGLQNVYDELITEDPTSPGAAALSMRRVLPADPNLDAMSSSLLVEKLRLKPSQLDSEYCAPSSQPDGCLGGEMPPGVDTYSTGKLDLIKNWIAAGAPFDGWPAGTSCGNPEDIYNPAVPLDPPPAGQGFQMHMPAPAGFFIQPGTEYEGCQWIAIPPEVTQTMYIDRVEMRLNPGTHHMLVFRDVPDSGPDAVPTSFDPDDTACNKQFGLKASFTGTQDPEFTQQLPTGVSFAVTPGQVFGINTHYTNPYNVPIYPEVWINFWGSTSPTPKLQKTIFPGDLLFSIPPYNAGGTRFAGNVIRYTQGASAGCFYSLTSHSHRRNLGFRMWDSDPSNGGALSDDAAWDVATNRFYDNVDWDHPIQYEPVPRKLMQPGQSIWFQCRWDNGGINPANITRRCIPISGVSCGVFNEFVCVTNADCGAGTTGACIDCPVDFGFLSEDEMCFLPGSYYDADPGPTPCPY